MGGMQLVDDTDEMAVMRWQFGGDTHIRTYVGTGATHQEVRPEKNAIKTTFADVQGV